MTSLGDLLAGPVVDVAPRLLGATLTRGEVAVRLTEVEAYGGADDPGSHAYRGPTPRTRVMFGPPGHLYAYFSYGMHVCANVVVGEAGEAGAVLLRAGEVVEGHELVGERRPGVAAHRLAAGPALLTRCLAITLDDDGCDLADGPVTLVPPPAAAQPSGVSSGPRVGLRGAPDRPWRFWLRGDPTVSAYRRHPGLVSPRHPR